MVLGSTQAKAKRSPAGMRRMGVLSGTKDQAKMQPPASDNIFPKESPQDPRFAS
ncbi:hypothetical protein V7S43_003887 [Phytophthora oleae]|uniref:Uncharacterized protein n=1 Tax=Phytophthora oleae TaxID=2107226 RepID=A0ABD3G0G5_9STRA